MRFSASHRPEYDEGLVADADHGPWPGVTIRFELSGCVTTLPPCLQSSPGRPCEYVRDGRRAGRKGCSDRGRTGRSAGVLTGLAPRLAPLCPSGWDSGSRLFTPWSAGVGGHQHLPGGGHDGSQWRPARLPGADSSLRGVVGERARRMRRTVDPERLICPTGSTVTAAMGGLVGARAMLFCVPPGRRSGLWVASGW
jgi:hypothetical protein